MKDKFQYGVLLPAFGSQASRERLIGGSVQIERYGFDSVWVRDHLVFHPHSHEEQNRTHVDPFIVLSTIASITNNLTLAFGVLIPHRHPIHTALSLGSLDFIAGPGRVLVGFGIGTYNHEFEVCGMGGWDRREVVREQVEIMRCLWTGEEVDWNGKYYRFKGVDIHPVPGKGRSIPIWYGGNSPAAVRRAVEYCDGWVPGRIPRFEYRERVERMRGLAEKSGKSIPDTGTIPIIVPAKSVEQAEKYLDVERLLEESRERHKPQRPDGFQSLDDLDGAVIVGPPDRIIEEVRLCQEAGASHFVFDLRPRFDRYEEMLQIIGEEVLPELHRGDGRQRG